MKSAVHIISFMVGTILVSYVPAFGIALFVLFQRYIGGPLNNYLNADPEIRISPTDFSRNTALLFLAEATLLAVYLALAALLYGLFVKGGISASVIKDIDFTRYQADFGILLWLYFTQWYLMVAPYTKTLYGGLSYAHHIRRRMSGSKMWSLFFIFVGYSALYSAGYKIQGNIQYAVVIMAIWQMYSMWVTKKRRRMAKKYHTQLLEEQY